MLRRSSIVVTFLVAALFICVQANPRHTLQRLLRSEDDEESNGLPAASMKFSSCLLEQFIVTYKEMTTRVECRVGHIWIDASRSRLRSIAIDVNIRLNPLQFHASNAEQLCDYLMTLHEVLTRARDRLERKKVAEGSESHGCLPAEYESALHQLVRAVEPPPPPAKPTNATSNATTPTGQSPQGKRQSKLNPGTPVTGQQPQPQPQQAAGQAGGTPDLRTLSSKEIAKMPASQLDRMMNQFRFGGAVTAPIPLIGAAPAPAAGDGVGGAGGVTSPKLQALQRQLKNIRASIKPVDLEALGHATNHKDPLYTPIPLLGSAQQAAPSSHGIVPSAFGNPGSAPSSAPAQPHQRGPSALSHVDISDFVPGRGFSPSAPSPHANEPSQPSLQQPPAMHMRYGAAPPAAHSSIQSPSSQGMTLPTDARMPASAPSSFGRYFHNSLLEVASTTRDGTKYMTDQQLRSLQLRQNALQRTFAKRQQGGGLHSSLHDMARAPALDDDRARAFELRGEQLERMYKGSQNHNNFYSNLKQLANSGSSAVSQVSTLFDAHARQNYVQNSRHMVNLPAHKPVPPHPHGHASHSPSDMPTDSRHGPKMHELSVLRQKEQARQSRVRNWVLNKGENSTAVISRDQNHGGERIDIWTPQQARDQVLSLPDINSAFSQRRPDILPSAVRALGSEREPAPPRTHADQAADQIKIIPADKFVRSPNDVYYANLLNQVENDELGVASRPAFLQLDEKYDDGFSSNGVVRSRTYPYAHTGMYDEEEERRPPPVSREPYPEQRGLRSRTDDLVHQMDVAVKSLASVLKHYVEDLSSGKSSCMDLIPTPSLKTTITASSFASLHVNSAKEACSLVNALADYSTEQGPPRRPQSRHLVHLKAIADHLLAIPYTMINSNWPKVNHSKTAPVCRLNVRDHQSGVASTIEVPPEAESIGVSLNLRLLLDVRDSFPPAIVLSVNNTYHACRVLSALQASMPVLDSSYSHAEDSTQVLLHQLGPVVSMMANVVAAIHSRSKQCESLLTTTHPGQLPVDSGISFELPARPHVPLISLRAKDMFTVCTLTEAMRAAGA